MFLIYRDACRLYMNAEMRVHESLSAGKDQPGTNCCPGEDARSGSAEEDLIEASDFFLTAILLATDLVDRIEGIYTLGEMSARAYSRWEMLPTDPSADL